jgi:putative oxidoreductase
MKAVFLLGRIVFGGFFLYNGINHFRQRQAMTQYTQAKGVPSPDLAVAASGAAMAFGGASIILGLQPKLGAAALAAFLAGASPLMHDFWNADEAGKQGELINFSKNMALLGAVLVLMAVEEPWPASVG